MLNWAIGIDMYTLMCIKLMTDKKKEEPILNSTGNSIQYSVMEICLKSNKRGYLTISNKVVHFIKCLLCTNYFHALF